MSNPERVFITPHSLPQPCDMLANTLPAVFDASSHLHLSLVDIPLAAEDEYKDQRDQPTPELPFDDELTQSLQPTCDSLQDANSKGLLSPPSHSSASYSPHYLAHQAACLSNSQRKLWDSARAPKANARAKSPEGSSDVTSKSTPSSRRKVTPQRRMSKISTSALLEDKKSDGLLAKLDEETAPAGQQNTGNPISNTPLKEAVTDAISIDVSSYLAKQLSQSQHLGVPRLYPIQDAVTGTSLEESAEDAMRSNALDGHDGGEWDLFDQSDESATFDPHNVYMGRFRQGPYPGDHDDEQ